MFHLAQVSHEHQKAVTTILPRLC